MEYSDALTALNNQYLQAMTYSSDAGNFLYEADTAWWASDDHTAIRKLIDSVSSLKQAVDYYHPYDSIFYPAGIDDMLFFLDTYFKVTMEKMLEAMTAAKFEELKEFTGLTDAYKVALWNAPFETEFYAGLARHFKGEAGW